MDQLAINCNRSAKPLLFKRREDVTCGNRWIFEVADLIEKRFHASILIQIDQKGDDISPWIQVFVNARKWLEGK